MSSFIFFSRSSSRSVGVRDIAREKIYTEKALAGVLAVRARGLEPLFAFGVMFSAKRGFVLVCKLHHKNKCRLTSPLAGEVVWRTTSEQTDEGYI